MDDKEKLTKIYDFVCRMENHYYNKISDDVNKNVLLTLTASAYQNVRYFIDNMYDGEDGK